MIRLQHVLAETHEYTCRCGWIDWTHAGERDDVIRLWRQFPHTVRAGQSSRPTPSPGGGGWIVRHRSISDPIVRTLGLPEHTWFVRNFGFDSPKYEQVALAIYADGCMRAEIAQVAMHEAFTHSGFSFEDFVSNLLSFYGHVKGYNQSQIRGMCGGFSNREERLRVARSVLTAMNNSGISQDRIKSSSWTYAYLFNDLCSECQLRDRNRGFRLLPDEFRSIHSPAPGDFFPNDPNSPRQQRLDHAASVGVIA